MIRPLPAALALCVCAFLAYPAETENETLLPPAQRILQIRDTVYTVPQGYYLFEELHINSGGLIAGEGTHVIHRGVFKSGPAHGGENPPGSKMVLRDGATWTQGEDMPFHFACALDGDYQHAHDHHLLVTGTTPDGKKPTKLDLNYGSFIVGGLRNDRTTSRNNSVTISDGALLDKTAVFLAHAQGGDRGSITLSGGARVNAFSTSVAYESGGSGNTITITGEGTVWDNGNGFFNVGSTRGGTPATRNSVLVKDKAKLLNVGNLSIGSRSGDNGNYVSGNKLTIAGGGEVLTSWGDVSVGYCSGGADMTDNALVLEEGGRLVTKGRISIGASSESSRNNMLSLRGGEISAANLSIHTANNLEVVIGPTGTKPVMIEENARFSTGARIIARCDDAEMAGRFHPIIECGGKIINIDDVLLKSPQPEYESKIQLSEDGKTLSLGVFKR